MCRPQTIPNDWLFVSSWVDGNGPYICATFVDPSPPYHTKDTQLFLRGETIERLACGEKVNPQRLTYEMVKLYFVNQRHQDQVLKHLNLTRGSEGPFGCQK